MTVPVKRPNDRHPAPVSPADDAARLPWVVVASSAMGGFGYPWAAVIIFMIGIGGPVVARILARKFRWFDGGT